MCPKSIYPSLLIFLSLLSFHYQLSISFISFLFTLSLLYSNEGAPARIMSASRYRLGVDVGGTHTDLVLLDTATGELLVEKVSSTPKNPALGVLDGVAKFIARGIAPDEIGFFAHGTTITTNALLEMRGAKVGLLITKGYRAVQEIQNQARDGNLFDYFYSKPAADRAAEPHQGNSRALRLRRPCSPAARREAVREAARELKDAGVESIAVCYLFSFMNPAHEEQTRALIHEEFPAVQVSLSSEVLPRIREWARLSTTLLNAYLEPVMVRYIAHLNGGLDSAGVAHAAALPDAIERRRDAVFGGDRRRPHRAHAVLRPRRGRAGQRLSRARGRAARPRHSRHGRHQRRHRLHRRRRAARSDRGGDRAPPDRRAGARHDDDLRRRRLDRLDRRRRLPQCRSAERRRRSRPGLLRTRRHAADGHRRRPRVRLSQSRLFPRRHADARCRGIARSAARRMSPPRCRWTCWRPPPASSASSTCAWPTRCACLRPSAASICPLSRCCRSAAPARYTPPRSPRSSACGAFWCRRVPGAFSALGLLCTDVVHDYIRSELRPLAEIAADHAEDIFRQLERKARDELAAEGMYRRRCALRARARPALYRPGLRTAHAARRAVRGSADR